MIETIVTNYDPRAHYALNIGPTNEFGDLDETPPQIQNIGWTLGNDCPYRCTHCYSFVARNKGRDMSVEMIERIVDQLALNNVKTVNLGGNEPLYTNGKDPKKTLLPLIISRLSERGIDVGITTSSVSVLYLYKHHRDAFNLLNDVDVSFDSSYEDEHNKNRGSSLFRPAKKVLEICQKEGKPHTAIMAAMKWNFTPDRIRALVELAASFDSHIRINPLKPVEPAHMDQALPAQQYYDGFSLLMELCDPVDLGEPPLAAVTELQDAKRCPCGRTSFRIHSITPTGAIYVSPCVYLHDYKAPFDLLKHDLKDIINSPQFRAFRQRNAHPEMLYDCYECPLLSSCGGGCAARSYLHHVHLTGEKTLLTKDPYCPIDINPSAKFPKNPKLLHEHTLVHADYLCTWIGKPKK